MKVTAYSIKSCEKEFITKANHKKHDITLISNRLTKDTIAYSKGKEAVFVFPGDDLSAGMLQNLHSAGVKYIVTRSTGTGHIDLKEADRLGLKVAAVASYSPESVAEHAVALMLALCRNIIPSHEQMMEHNFTLDRLVGTTIHSKRVGVVGFGETGKALAQILRGFGAKTLVADIKDVATECAALDAEQVTLETLYKQCDIISYHVPLTDSTRHMVNAETIGQMKDGVLLINVSRGAVFNSIDVYNALQRDKIGKLGMDVYEFENHVFFYDRTYDDIDDQLLQSFIQHSRVLLTPHQAFLTKEALHTVAERTIQGLDFLVSGNNEAHN